MSKGRFPFDIFVRAGHRDARGRSAQIWACVVEIKWSRFCVRCERQKVETLVSTFWRSQRTKNRDHLSTCSDLGATPARTWCQMEIDLKVSMQRNFMSCFSLRVIFSHLFRYVWHQNCHNMTRKSVFNQNLKLGSTCENQGQFVTSQWWVGSTARRKLRLYRIGFSEGDMNKNCANCDKSTKICKVSC